MEHNRLLTSLGGWDKLVYIFIMVSWMTFLIKFFSINFEKKGTNKKPQKHLIKKVFCIIIWSI